MAVAIFLHQRVKSSNDASRHPAHGVLEAEDGVRLLLAKNPARSFSCPWYQVHGISFGRFPWPWQTVALTPV